MRHLVNKRTLSVAAAISAVAVIAACSSSGGATSDTAGSGSSTILIGGVGPIQTSVLAQPERLAGEQAAISTINAAGGINGHMLKLDWCDTEYTANGEFTCMRQLLADKVTAIVDPGLSQDQSDRGLVLDADAGIPIIGGQGLSPVEFTAPGSFPISSGNPGYAYGQVVSMIKAGATKIALWGTTEPASTYIISVTEQAMKQAGITPVRYVETDPSSDPTFAQSAAEVIAGDVNGVIYDSSPVYSDKAIQALRTAGYKGPVGGVTGTFTPLILQALGADANNLYLTSQIQLQTATTNPGVKAFLAGMKKYQPKAAVDEISMTSWTAVQLFADVAKTIKGDITSQSVMAGMNDISSPINLGTAGPYMVKGVLSPIKGFPRIFNQTVVIGVVKNGVLEPFASGFVDPFTSLNG
jgi:branched-chain amino acid transport system substrate-binding protein